MEKNNSSKTLVVLMSICVCLSIITLGIVIYDRFIKEEPENVIIKAIEPTADINEICNNINTEPDILEVEEPE